MGNEKFNRALRAMKALEISTNVVSPILKNLLKLYNNEWEHIEAENYRVLIDAVFEAEEEEKEQEKQKQKQKKRRRRNSNKVAMDSEEEDEEEEENEGELQYEYVPPLTRARSVVITRVVHHEAEAETDAGFQAVLVEEERTEFDIEEASPTEKKIKLECVCVDVDAMAKGKGKKIAGDDESGSDSCKVKASLALPAPLPLPRAGLKIPKIEVMEDDMDPNSAITCFGTPIVEEKSMIIESEGEGGGITAPLLQMSPKIEHESLAVLPIANMPFTPQQNEHGCDFEGLQTSKGGSYEAESLSALGAIAEAYMEMDNDEDEFLSEKLKNHLLVINRDANANVPHYNNDHEGSSHIQLYLEYNNGIEEAVCMQTHLECNNDIKESSHELACLEYNNGIHVSSNGQTNFNTSVTETDIPQQLCTDRVLEVIQVQTLQLFKMLAPDFPATKLMEKLCQQFLKSRNNQACSENHTQAVSVETNLLMSNDNVKIGWSQEPPVADKGNNHDESKNNICTMLISLEPCELDVEQSKPRHDLKDISRGEESIPIPIVNELSSETCPPPFQYIQRSIVYQNAYVNFSLARIGDDDCCSNCSGNCVDSPITCACARETGGEYAYTPDGTLKKEFLEEAMCLHMKPKEHHLFYCKDCPNERAKNEYKPEPCKGHLIRKFIKECWSKCGCNKQCGNRVVQRGINRKLQVFLTPEGKGWGVRTLEEIPRGTFVCEYVGEILTNTELYNRNNEGMGDEKHHYPVLLDADWCSEGVLKDEEALCLDATHYGNVARFINHRCYDANLMEIPVEVESPDRHCYHLAFFTTRKVEALEELTWDYGIDFEDYCHPVKAFECRCGSGHCRDVKRLARRRILRR